MLELKTYLSQNRSCTFGYQQSSRKVKIIRTKGSRKKSFFNDSDIKALTPHLELNGSRNFAIKKSYFFMMFKLPLNFYLFFILFLYWNCHYFLFSFFFAAFLSRIVHGQVGIFCSCKNTEPVCKINLRISTAFTVNRPLLCCYHR